VQAFVDLRGASGAGYRFRLSPGGEGHSPTAGNYALVRADDAGFRVFAIASTNDLTLATTSWKRAQSKRSDLLLYTRLNVSGAVREAEEQDIASYYKLRVNRQTA
jgi:hypothetical protein